MEENMKQNMAPFTPGGEERATLPVVEGTTLKVEEGASLKIVEGAKKEAGKETRETQRMKENFHFFGPVTAAYALFYAFCMYKNSAGITFPFFLASSLLYFGFSMKKLGLTFKKGSIFYMISVMLLAVSTFCTADEKLIFLNQLGIILLMFSFLLSQFFHTEQWGLGKYLGSILETFFASFSEMNRPIGDGVQYVKSHQGEEKRKIYYVLLGLVITIPLLLIVAALLGSADAVFRQVTDTIWRTINLSNVFGVVLRIVLWYFGAYMLLANLCNHTLKEEVKDHRSGEPLVAITITAMLSLLYLFFSWIQIVYLFLGKLQLPEGYTYATYAREGFFQLLAVSVLNLIIVLVCMAFFRESRVLKGILTVMSLCTFVMIASSGLRMILYIQTYNLTFLRIFVLWSLCVLTLLFIGVLISIYRRCFPLFRYSVTVVTCLYVALSFAHPDLIIAKFNLENADARLDYSYLSELSEDAAPVLVPYLREQGYVLSVIKAEDKAPRDDETEQYGRNEMTGGYWPSVEKVSGGERESRGNAQGFGYYYLERIWKARRSMTIRSFNLSRWLAVRATRQGF